MSDLDLTKIQLTWCLDILARIKNILDSKGWTEEQKLVSITWLVKQACKAEKEE
jgi:hypothetical protein